MDKIRIGDIFVDTFSYEYTRVSFMQVISKYGTKVILRKIKQELVGTDGSGRNEDIMPLKDQFLNDELITQTVKSLCGEDIYLSGTSSCRSVHSWDGKACYQTNSYWC